MSWFRNHYECDCCNAEWTDDWSSKCDDDCPLCGARHMSPHDSDDLTVVIERRNRLFVVYRSPASAAHGPDYKLVGDFLTLARAEAQAHELLNA